MSSSWKTIGPGLDRGRDFLGVNNQNPVIANSPGITSGPGTVAPQYSPGLQQGTAFAGDYNMQGPGAAESYFGAAAPFYGQAGFGDQWWQQNQGQFGQPGAMENYWQQAQGKLAQGPGTTQNAQNYYNNWSDQSKNLDADMGAFYDRAKERSAADIDKSFGARGMFGSSAATSQVGQTMADLEAQRARDEAQYGLNRAAEQRAWSGLGGGLAGAADQSNLANSGMDLSWLQGGAGMAGGAQNAQLARLMGAGGLAQGFDANALNRVNSGMNAALGAQDARRTRVQDMFNNTAMPAMATFGMQNQYYPQMFANDQALMDASILMGTGLAQDMVNSDRYATEKWRNDDRHAMDIFGSFFGGMMGG